jgi:hypothetical protein
MSSKPAPANYSKIVRINEYLWLFFAAVSIILTVYSLISGNREQAIYFLALTFLSGLFYSFKKRMRKRYEARELEQKQGKNSSL